MEPANSAQTTRVLVVDDEPLVRTLLRRMLVQEGYEVTEAADGQSALDALRDAHDLILLDVMLADESGLDVLAAIRSADDIPVMLVTGRDDQDASRRHLLSDSPVAANGKP